jgi:hypothetical protein
MQFTSQKAVHVVIRDAAAGTETTLKVFGTSASAIQEAISEALGAELGQWRDTVRRAPLAAKA